MFLKYVSVFLVFNVLVFSDSAFVDTLVKCHINDGKCQKDLFQKVMVDIAETGVPELDIPPIDPIELKNISVNILDVIDITMIEGHAKGVKGCVIDRFEVLVEDERAFAEVTCPTLTIKGLYEVYSESPLIKTLLNGDKVHGKGNGKVKIEKLKLKFDFFFYIQKRDGELYIKCKADKTKYDYDIKGKMSFFADKIYIGDVESSKLVTGVLNENWRFLMASFGKPFFDKATSFFYDFFHKFLEAVSVKYFIIDDLSSYARE